MGFIDRPLRARAAWCLALLFSCCAAGAAACGGGPRPGVVGSARAPSPATPLPSADAGPAPSFAPGTPAPAAGQTAGKRPVVGVNGYVVAPGEQGDSGMGNYRVTRTYRDALVKAGALAVHLLPAPEADVAAILDRVDCLVLGGGPDIQPATYGEQPHPSVSVLSPERQKFDFALAREALRRRIPVLGICLGSQELNVTLGGSMIQDIPSEVPNAQDHRQLGVDNVRRGVHEIQLVPGTRLAAMYGGQVTIRVNSAHHQASDVMGRGLVVAARSPDGVVEGFEAPGYPFLIGVQFHPEMQAEPAGQHDRLFREFVAACASYAARRK